MGWRISEREPRIVILASGCARRWPLHDIPGYTVEPDARSVTKRTNCVFWGENKSHRACRSLWAPSSTLGVITAEHEALMVKHCDENCNHRLKEVAYTVYGNTVPLSHLYSILTLIVTCPFDEYCNDFTCNQRSSISLRFDILWVG